VSSPDGTRYEPGSCNIGEGERRQRRRWAQGGLLIAVVYGVGVLALGLPSFLLLGLFVPLMLSLEWGIESRRAFCVRLAVAGQWRFGDRRGQVTDGGSRRQDATTAVQITAAAAVVAATLTVLVYALAVGL
jgi:hypothetical protein